MIHGGVVKKAFSFPLKKTDVKIFSYVMRYLPANIVDLTWKPYELVEFNAEHPTVANRHWLGLPTSAQ